jgi:hypothetical protein
MTRIELANEGGTIVLEHAGTGDGFIMPRGAAVLPLIEELAT